MRNKILSFLTVFLLSSALCNASVYDYKTNAANLVKELPKMDSIECKFKQERKLVNIQKPLISGGNFKFDKKKGVFFETTYPIKSVTSYTGRDYQQINDVILAISNRQYARLDKNFDFYYQKNPKDWILGLKPKNKTVTDKYIETITISGTDYINKIVIKMKDGSTTTQWFWIE